MEVIFNQSNKDFRDGQTIIRRTFVAPIIIIEEELVPNGNIQVACHAREQTVTTLLNKTEGWDFTELSISSTKIKQ